VVIAGVGVGGYNGVFTITAPVTATTFSYTDWLPALPLQWCTEHCRSGHRP